MDIGTGIAIAGVWMLPVAAMLSRFVTGEGVLFTMIVAALMTWLIK